MIFETKCKQCGKTVCILSVSLWSYKIGELVFCGHNCKCEYQNEQEEKKRKREEAALERERQRHRERLRNARRKKKYMFNKDDPEPLAENQGGPGTRSRPVLKIRVSDGEVVKRFNSLTEAASDAGISVGTMSRKVNGHYIRVKEFIWKYEDEV